jgi:translation initiation factor IF-3
VYERNVSRENEKFYRVNGQIRISPIVVIGADGRNMGSVPTQRALEIAVDSGLDLVEISPTSRPPVCRIMDFGKFKFEQNLKEKKQRKKQKQGQVKEVRLSPSIQEHDVDTKLKSAVKFLSAGNRVNVRLDFKRREISHKEIGFSVMESFLGRLKDHGTALSRPKSEGRSISCMVEPNSRENTNQERKDT